MNCPECDGSMVGPMMFGEIVCEECGYIALTWENEETE